MDTQPHTAFQALLARLRSISRKGPIQSVGHGATSVGMTLLSELGVDYTSLAKPNFQGIVVNARRRTLGRSNRVNLFAQVPEWKISHCKSSRQIVEQYGYDADDESRRLYCTVRANHPNPQGLFLELDRGAGLLRERFRSPIGESDEVAAWRLPILAERLTETHPETVWVRAVASTSGSSEFFHYREAQHVGPPKVEILDELLNEGTITVDHLIKKEGTRVNEKGPLFKIDPVNFDALFPAPLLFDLMSPG